jgi:hypothetical protein
MSKGEGRSSFLEALTLARNDSERVPEGSLTCGSPVCDVRFKQTGMEMSPKRFCSDRCRLDTWMITHVSKLLAGLSDERKLEVLR